MRLTAILALLTLTCLVFAGCASKGNGDGSVSSTSSSGPSSTTSKTSNGSSSSSSSSSKAPGNQTGNQTGNATNHAPLANLTAVPMNGTAPLNVTFSVSGSDPDGDTLTWALTFGDGAQLNGTTLPSNASHTYANAGNLTARLTVSDSRGLTATANVTLNIGAASVGPTGPHQAVDLAWKVGGGFAGFPQEYGGCADGQGAGNTMDSFMLDQSTVGRPFTATVTDAASGADIQDWTIIFSEPDCSADLKDFSADGAAPITGVVPAGAHNYVMVYSTGGANLVAHYETA